MSDTNHAAAGGAAHGHDEKYYIKIWGILCVLLVVSILGPELGNFYVMLVTAFGIAFVKAYLVAKHFMHLDTEKPVVWYMLTCCLAFMVLFFAAVSPDVMNHEGRRWVNVSALRETERALEAAKAAGQHEGSTEHGGGEAAPAGGGH